ncbi:MAG: hypothetical protein H7308_02250 [Chthonomonadaceae bacterium]|nr:hypothetical protein [Chthonomonadaceae bacterium]
MQLRTCLTLFVSLMFLLSQSVLQGQRKRAFAPQPMLQQQEKQEKAVYEVPFEYDASVSHFLIVKVKIGGGNPQRFILSKCR